MINSNQENTSTKLAEFLSPSLVLSSAIGPQSGSLALTGSKDRKARLWSLEGSPRCLALLQGHTSGVSAILFSPSERQVCGGSETGTIKAWDTETAKLHGNFYGHRGAIKSIDFDFGETFMVSGSSDGAVKLWDLRQKSSAFNFAVSCPYTLTCVKFSPCAQYIASGGSDNRVRIWDLRAKKLVYEFKDHMAAVTHLAFHSSASMLVSTSSDGSTNVCDLKRFQVVSTLRSIRKSASRRLLFDRSQPRFFAAGDAFLDIVACTDEDYWTYEETGTSSQQPWSRVLDLAMPLEMPNKLVCVSARSSSVFIHTVDIEMNNPQGRRPAESTSTTIAAEAPYENTFVSSKKVTGSEHCPNCKGDNGNTTFVVGDEVTTTTPEVLEAPAVADTSPPNFRSEKTFVVQKPFVSSFEDSLSAILEPSAELQAQLKLRNSHLLQLHAIWTSKDKKKCAEYAVSMANSDITILVSFLEIIRRRMSWWTLDMCLIVLRALPRLLRSQYEEHVLVGCSVLRLILKGFAEVIQSALQGSKTGAVGVDLHQEERLRKCLECDLHLAGIKKLLEAGGRTRVLNRGRPLAAVRELLKLFL